MADLDDSLRSEISSSFQELGLTANSLNTASDTLGAFFAQIEDVIKSLGLGVSAWVTIAEGGTSRDETWCQQVGYAKVAKNWCLAIRSYTEVVWLDEWSEYEVWPINEAPRELRVKAVSHIPGLLKKLNQEAKEVTDEIQKSVGTAAEIAETLNTMVGRKKKATNGAQK